MGARFNETLIELLKTDPRFIDDGDELVKAAVIDRAWKIDHDLVRLLLKRPEIKSKFFDEIEGHWIFNLNTFIEYLADKNFLANSYTRFRNKIGLNIDGKFLRERGEVSLVWPYKDCVLEGGQTNEEEKRKEIFFNEILAHDEIDRLFWPKVLTNWKRYTVDGEQKVVEIRRDAAGTIRENLIIKGNNLLALHSLKKQFRGKVKLIYIDPPYNTGNDSFGYNDNFNHSSWLTFMKNRLEVARDLLKNDGSIWINIDDEEAHYLKVLCDEIFGRENFVANVVWHKNYALANDSKGISSVHDHILVYQKSASFQRNLLPRTDKQNSLYKYDSNDGKGLWRSDNLTVKTYSEDYDYVIINPNTEKEYHPTKGRCWVTNKSTMQEWVTKGRVFFGQDGKGAPQLKRYLIEVQNGIVPTTCWPYSEVGHNDEARKEIKTLFNDGLFKTPKPEKLLQRIVNLSTQQNDIVLDFHLGSGTTAAVAHKMGRQFIGIEQMDYIETIPVSRLKKVMSGEQGGISKSVGWQGGGDLISCELMKYNENYMDAIQSADSSEELVALWLDIAKNSFLNWYIHPENPEEAVHDFVAIGTTDNGLDKQKQLLAELLNKNQLYLNLSEIEDADFAVSEEDKKLNQSFYGESL